MWFHRYENGRDIEGRFDYNSWQESETGRKLAASLDKDTIIVEGYKQFVTDRKAMAKMGNWRDNKDFEIPLDGIGGVSILVKADVHRSGSFSILLLFFSPLSTFLCQESESDKRNPSTGINFPCYAFENQAETEGFAKMAKRAGYEVYGLPNYVVWHIDTEEKPGNA